ncbi:MAG TPA: amidohydrolase family protein [Chitinophagaceae bacterium]|nr:amidohydrolase family protein [Chitinophagaceae bacterium]
MKFRLIALAFLQVIVVVNSAYAQSLSVEYDIVLSGGRVIDPETKLDAIRNVGIIQNRIAQISSEPLKGKQVINVAGLVVAPGFIDLHVHGRSNREQEYQLHDGLTTALELEWGIENLKEWYASRHSRALINYGASVCWPYERFKAINTDGKIVTEMQETSFKGESSLAGMQDRIQHSYTMDIQPGQMNTTLENIKRSLAEGGVGIGVPIGYLPKTKPEEMYEVFKLAGELDALVYTHVRQPDIISIQEVITDAILTRAPLHIVHVNSMSLGHIQMALDLVNQARKSKFDVTTELYPYTAGSTRLQGAMFDEGWQQRLGIDYKDLQWVATGERLTKQSFDKYQKEGGVVILHVMKPEWINTGIAAPGVMIGSDGMPYAPLAHPRTAGTFSRVLGKYVREEKLIDLNTAIEKMTILPAKRLEGIAPMMRFKGRIQVGADADITVFNPNTVIDKASFDKGLAFSEGIEYVIVNGVLALKNGKTVGNTFPGQPIFGKFKK